MYVHTYIYHTYVLYFIGIKYRHPPPYPPNNIKRQILMDEIVTKLLQAATDCNKYETTLTITGAGGFGKTTTVISLCYHPSIKEHFTDGFLFIELGPQASHPSVKLSQLYHQLTGEHLKYFDINHAEQEIRQLTSDYYHNLLVIIDDVWHVEDAEPLVKAFCNCKTVLTTRMKNFEQYIPFKQSVSIGPMTQQEAISLLTSGIIDGSQLSQEDVSLLDELAQDVHLWPLLLSLIKGQLRHNLKVSHLPYHRAIQNVQGEIHRKGLKAFDKTNPASVNRSRKFAVEVCVETTLKLLTKSSSKRIKSLILYNGIGTSLQTAVLNNLWNISKQEADDTVEVLWAYGLVQYTEVTLSPNNITQQCVEVHTIISHYFIECMDSSEAFALSPNFGMRTADSVSKGLRAAFQESYGVQDISLLTSVDYLKYKVSEIENDALPYHLKKINMFIVTDPHNIILILQKIRDASMCSPHTKHLLSSLDKEISSITNDCKQILQDTHKMCRKLNQSVQRNLHEKNYSKLIETVEEFAKSYPLCNAAQKAAVVLQKSGEVIPMVYEVLQMMSSGYHDITTKLLPLIKLHIKLHNQFSNSLTKGSPYIESDYNYIGSGKYHEDYKSLDTKYLMKMQEVAPNFARYLASLP